MRVRRVLKYDKSGLRTPGVELSLMDPLIEEYRGRAGSMIPLLQGVQALYGFIPGKAFDKLARETGMSVSEMYGVATFYAQFRLRPAGRNIIRICHGTACHVQNADSISEAVRENLKIKDGETTPDGLFTLESVACLGCCSLAPVMMIGEKTYGKLTSRSTLKIIREIKRKEHG